MVNPIDGMGNFVRGIPVFATTVAYCENGEVKASVVYNRASDELYFAEKGSGAYKEGFRNHERLRVSAVKDGAAALVAASIGFQHGSAEYTAAYRDLFAETENVRLLGSVALSLAGVGRRQNGRLPQPRQQSEFGGCRSVAGARSRRLRL